MFLGGFFLFNSIVPLSYDVSVFVGYCKVPWFPILPFSIKLVSINKSVCPLAIIFPIFPFSFIPTSLIKSVSPLTISFPILPFPYIHISIRIIYNTQATWLSVLYLTMIIWVGVFITETHPYFTSRSFPFIKYFPLMIISKQRRRKGK